MAGRHRTLEYEFDIQLLNVTFNLIRNMDLVILGQKESVISLNHIKATSSISQRGRDIIYTIASEPKQGKVYRLMDTRPRRVWINVEGNFTQAELNQERIIYRLNHLSDVPITDTFKFTVSVGNHVLRNNIFTVVYRPSLSSELDVTNIGLNVDEGGQNVITSQELYVQSLGVKNYTYFIKIPPQHGTLIHVRTKRNGDVIVNNVTSFNNRDLQSHQLLYRHDDSEHNIDTFEFMARAVIGRSPDLGTSVMQSYNGTFHISVSEVFHTCSKYCRISTYQAQST